MADHRHKRDTDARRLFGSLPTAQKLSAGLAVVATTSVVAVGVLGAGPVARDLVAADARRLTASLSSTSLAASADARERFVVSRSASRKQRQDKDAVQEARADGALAATATAVRKAVNNGTKLWTTTVLNLWTQSGEDAQQVGEIAASRQVLVTGRQAGERVEIVVAGKSRWVTDGYLSEDEARRARCRRRALDGALPGPRRRERPDLRRRLRLPLGVPRLPADHVVRRVGQPRRARLGPRLDIMTSDVVARQRHRGVPAGARLRAAPLRHPLAQRIWTPVRAAEGWRTFPSRGSATANHYDHVHVSVY